MLPYQEKIISEILSATSIQGARILEIGGTPPWTVANKLIEMGAKSVTSINYRSDLENLRISDSIDFYNIDARIMSSVLKEKYDLIFGIAVIEHLPNLETILGECVKILNTNGRIALHGAAFWSSNLGHHVFVHIDNARYEFNANNPIDDFSHIYFSKQEMETHLIEVKQLPATHATAIVNYIYDNPILNRYHYEDILSSYKRAGLEFSYFRHSNWKTPTSDTLDRIQARLDPYFSQIYNNYSCGELLLIASVN